MSTLSASALASGSPTAMVWMTTPFCAAMSAALAGRHAAAGVGAVGEQDQDAGLDLELASKERMARPMASPSMVFWPAMPGSQRVEQAAGGGGVAGEGDEDVGGAAEDDQADAVVAAVGDEAVEDRLHAVEAGAAGAVRADEVAGLHRAGDVDGEHDVAGGLGALDRVADPLGAGEGEHDERPEEPGEGHLPAGSAAGRRRPRPCRGRRSPPRRRGSGRPAPPRGAAARARARGAAAAGRRAPRGRRAQACWRPIQRRAAASAARPS